MESAVCFLQALNNSPNKKGVYSIEDIRLAPGNVVRLIGMTEPSGQKLFDEEFTFDQTGHVFWPIGNSLCNFIHENQEIFKGTYCLELGSGLGLVGIYASQFCKLSVLTDRNEEAIEIQQRNITVNQREANCFASVLSWGDLDQLKALEDQFCDSTKGAFDIMLASDVIHYNEQHIPLLYDTVNRLMKDQGTFYLAHTNRNQRMYELLMEGATKLFEIERMCFEVPKWNPYVDPAIYCLQKKCFTRKQRVAKFEAIQRQISQNSILYYITLHKI